jgi:hypothetical protein
VFVAVVWWLCSCGGCGDVVLAVVRWWLRCAGFVTGSGRGSGGLIVVAILWWWWRSPGGGGGFYVGFLYLICCSSGDLVMVVMVVVFRGVIVCIYGFLCRHVLVLFYPVFLLCCTGWP